MAFAARLDELPLCDEGAKEMGRQLQKFLDDCGKVGVDPVSYTGWLKSNAGGFIVHHVELVMDDIWSHFHDPGCLNCWPIENRIRQWKHMADEMLRQVPSTSRARAANNPPPYAATHRRQKGALVRGQAYLTQFLG